VQLKEVMISMFIASLSFSPISREINQGSAEHAMRNNDKDSVAAAKTRTCNFIKSKIDAYKRNKDSPDVSVRDAAFFSLGEALHPIMDSTSPMHQGWQVWDPYSTQGMKHGNAHGSHEGVKDLTPELLNRTVDLINKALNGNPCACTL